MEVDQISANRLDRLESMVRCAQTGRIPDLRTKLDEWKAFTDRGGLLTSGGRQRWFNNPCPWREFARLRAHMDWITPSAEQILELAEQRDLRVRKPKAGQPAPFRLIVEHAVPVKVIHDHIVADPALWDVGSLEGFLLTHYKRGVLTSDEDALLNRAVVGESASLRQRMPTGWTIHDDDPYARYRAVGLRRHQYG
jgi:hypothetical protein